MRTGSKGFSQGGGRDFGNSTGKNFALPRLGTQEYD
jgi:hypothetical protein